MSELPTVEVESVLATGVSYGIVQPGQPDPSGVPIVRVTDLVGDRIASADPLRVARGVEAEYLRTRLSGGEVLLSVVGTVGRVAVVPDELAGWNVARAVAVLRPRDVDDSRWLRYALLAPQCQVQMHMRKNDTVQATLNLKDVRTLSVPWPEKDERGRIAAVLSSLDDLIERNRGQSGVMNDLWRTLVLSHADGADEVKLSDLARFVNGRNFTKDASGGGLPVIRTPEVRNGPSANTVRSDVQANEDNVARLGDILFVWSGSLLVDRWAYEPGLVNQHIFKVLPNDGVPAWLALWAIEQLMVDFLGVAADKATTMGHIKREDLNRTVNVPPREQWSELDAKIMPLYDLSMDLQAEINDLTRTRDELLPLLMSGAIRVDETLEVSA